MMNLKWEQLTLMGEDGTLFDRKQKTSIVVEHFILYVL